MDKQKFVKGLLTSLLLGGLAACATTPANIDAAKQAYASANYSTAYPQFKKLSAQGDVQAEDYLGLMYLNGQGVTRDYVTAEHWLSLAADGGAADAQFNLGNIYLAGLTGTQDYAQAMQLYREEIGRAHV